MNKTLKKIIILLSVYLVIFGIVFSIPGYVLNIILSKATDNDLLGKYVEITPHLANLENQSLEDQNKAFILRDVLSDSVIKEDIVNVEYAYFFCQDGRDIPFSSGCYARTCRKDKEGKAVNFKNNFALVDLKKLSGGDAGEALLEFSQQDTYGVIRLDRYAVEGFECYPLTISLLSNNQVVKTLNCNETLDLSGMEVYSADDTYMSTISLYEKMNYVQSDCHEAYDEIVKLKDKINYSGNQIISNKKVTPFTSTLTVISTQDGYGLIAATRIHTEKLLKPIRLYGLIGWTVIMGTVSAIVLLVGRKKH